MKKLLKGNYRTKINVVKKSPTKRSGVTDIFESRALKKLGGSIAFVMKTDKFIWGNHEKVK